MNMWKGIDNKTTYVLSGTFDMNLLNENVCKILFVCLIWWITINPFHI